ncbi:MAG: GxxExxY protein, partial [Proteobacteria bacterium]
KLSDREELLAKKIVDIAFNIHKQLGPGLLESVYAKCFYYELRGRKNALYDELAYYIAQTITVNKSMAVVLGVAPLLLINVLYTVWFYAANALTGSIWILVVPSVAAAFLLTYLHKYSWKKLAGHKAIHISIIAVAVVIFLFIPLVFLTNINLMLFPDRWSQVEGFASALMLPNVIPRYFHFLGASLAATGLFLVWMVREQKWVSPNTAIALEKDKLIREFYTLALIVSCLQFLVGPLVLFTLPAHGLNLKMLAAIFTGIGFAIPSLLLIWKELKEPTQTGQRVVKIGCLLGITVLFMASGRHFYREQALASHKKAIELKTAECQKLVHEANVAAASPPVAIREEDI